MHLKKFFAHRRSEKIFFRPKSAEVATDTNVKKINTARHRAEEFFGDLIFTKRKTPHSLANCTGLVLALTIRNLYAKFVP